MTALGCRSKLNSRPFRQIDFASLHSDVRPVWPAIARAKERDLPIPGAQSVALYAAFFSPRLRPAPGAGSYGARSALIGLS